MQKSDIPPSKAQTQTYLQRARVAVLCLLRQLQRALLPVFALTVDLLAALELEPQFSNLLRDGRTHEERFNGGVGVGHIRISSDLPEVGKVHRKLIRALGYKLKRFKAKM